jgi:precorrin-2/cobalt-factor-2 C20-methyltransferase
MPVLIGLGLGPGEPELLTLRAVRLLKEADAVFVPGTIAHDLVAPYRDAAILDFPMTGDEERIRSCMEQNADRIAAVARSGIAVFGILGDPNFFSTYTRLSAIMKTRYPGIRCRTEPGISAITAFASIADLSISSGFLVTDGPAEARSRIMLKVRKPRQAADALRAEGFRSFVLVERMCMEETKVYRNEELPEESDYMSVLYAER